MSFMFGNLRRGDFVQAHLHVACLGCFGKHISYPYVSIKHAVTITRICDATKHIQILKIFPFQFSIPNMIPLFLCTNSTHSSFINQILLIMAKKKTKTNTPQDGCTGSIVILRVRNASNCNCSSCKTRREESSPQTRRCTCRKCLKKYHQTLVERHGNPFGLTSEEMQRLIDRFLKNHEEEKNS